VIRQTLFWQFLLFSAVPVVAWAQSQGTFTSTGSLTTQRMDHTATLLDNGEVLIAGGGAVLEGWPTWSTAELYAPARGTFTSTGSMVVARASHTATLLPDGKVLIAGGSPTTQTLGFLSSAELYDPSTELFTATAAMTVARVGHTATLLNNGQVLLAGGSNPQTNGVSAALASAELYDPATGTFKATGSMTIGRAGHKAILLPDGRVLIVGGDQGHNPPAEVYDPLTGTFALAGSSAYPDDYFPETATLLVDGNVLTTLNDGEFSNKAELYNPVSGNFTVTSNMTTNRGYSTSTLLPDGKVLITGLDGLGGGSSELYDSAAGVFSATGGVATSQEGHTATLLPDGSVLLAGGWICCGYSVATAELYHPAVLEPSPLLYSLPGGSQGAILHAVTNDVVSPANPAVRGEALEIYGAGLIEGGAIPPQVAIGGRLAEVLFFGDAPGYPGLNQINVRVPNGIAPGSAVPIRLNYLGRPSNEVTVAIQ